MFGANKNSHVSIVFHIGTSSVSALAFSIHKEGGTRKPSIRNILRSSWEVKMAVDADMLHRQILESMRSLVPAILKEAGHVPENILIGLSAPFYSSWAAVRTLERKNPQQVIEKSELDAVLQQESDKLVIFARIPQVTMVNGYRIKNPVGAKGKTIQVQIRWEATTSDLYKDLIAPFEALRLQDRVACASVPNAYFHTMDNGASPADAMLYIDIGGEMTNIFMVRDHILSDVLLIPEGSHSLVRRVADMLHRPLNEAEFLVKRFCEGTLGESEQPAVADSIAAGIDEWKQQVDTGLKNYSANALVPSRALVCGEGAYISKYKEALILPELIVNALKPEALREQFHDFGYVRGEEDVSLLCLALLSTKEIL